MLTSHIHIYITWKSKELSHIYFLCNLYTLISTYHGSERNCTKQNTHSYTHTFVYFSLLLNIQLPFGVIKVYYRSIRVKSSSKSMMISLWKNFLPFFYNFFLLSPQIISSVLLCTVSFLKTNYMHNINYSICNDKWLLLPRERTILD